MKTPGHVQAWIDIFIAAREDGASKEEANERANRETGACTYCWRLANLAAEQRATEPWPTKIQSCSAHRRVAEEITEAREAG